MNFRTTRASKDANPDYRYQKTLRFGKKSDSQKGVIAREWRNKPNGISPAQLPARVLALQFQEENAKNFKAYKEAKQGVLNETSFTFSLN